MSETILSQTDTETETDNACAPLVVTDSAAGRIRAIQEAEGKTDLRLRVSVSGGGCSGFQYHFDLDGECEDGDVVIEKNGVEVVVDEMSLVYLTGARVDFVENLTGSYFSLDNPNASSSCGCGTSFAI